MKSSNLYKENFEKFGVSPKSLLWKSKGAAHQRFRQIWKEVNFDGKKVLDVGCGFGELGNFLTKRYKNVDYTGVDIVEEFIENGKKIYPHLNLKLNDYFNQPLPEVSDVVVASGTLNSNFEKDNLGFRKRAIKTMFDHTNDVLIFNMLGGHPAPVNRQDSNIWYSDSLEILEYCMSLTRRVVLRANYHPRDFTIAMYKLQDKL